MICRREESSRANSTGLRGRHHCGCFNGEPTGATTCEGSLSHTFFRYVLQGCAPGSIVLIHPFAICILASGSGSEVQPNEPMPP